MSNELQDDARIGILVVGLGGANGVTLVAGQLANQQKLSWEGASPWGRVDANLLGCITQLQSKGGTGGYKEKYRLASFCNAAVGGWDIRATPLGDALYHARILEYDLVRQVRDEMNKMVIMPGVWDPDFIGESQHSTATNVLHAAIGRQERVGLLRADIRRWKKENKVTGHTTVIWSASVERPSKHSFEDTHDLLSAIQNNDKEVSPSMLYAVAAAREGCSFVNGGSQNTICKAIVDLFKENSVYVLGTDFKAGQTKFKTAAVEYIRKMGLTPKVIASSNHLGNNDMYNLTSKRTLDAKMRVKNDIFGPWEEQIDHQVRVMYTPLIGDEKRDIVEYTSVGFMNCTHTMLTYTRAMDSALCVPLMIDGAVWCDVFHRNNVDHALVSQATAYLFKVPEGGCLGSDPGFFNQMERLDRILEQNIPKRTADTQDTETEIDIGCIVCAGVSCLDIQLCGASQGANIETINTFQETKYCAGGSCPQVSTALKTMKVKNVIAITKVGIDANGTELERQMSCTGVNCEHLIKDKNVQTAIAVLPIYKDTGGRGCFVNLAANNTLAPDDILTQLFKICGNNNDVKVFHFGYPHFLPLCQGENLKKLFEKVKEIAGDDVIISVDLNGVDNNDSQRSLHESLLGPAFALIDVLHANQEESRAISGEADYKKAAQWFLSRGVCMVAVTLGSEGSHIAVTQGAPRIAKQLSRFAGSSVTVPTFPLTPGAHVNSNGAGDAYVAGLLCGLCWSKPFKSLESLGKLATLAALERVDSIKRDKCAISINILVQQAQA